MITIVGETFEQEDCPKCKSAHVELSDAAASIRLFQECLICRFVKEGSPHKVASVEEFKKSNDAQLIIRRSSQEGA
jgi:hypothetical protein